MPIVKKSIIFGTASRNGETRLRRVGTSPSSEKRDSGRLEDLLQTLHL